MTRKRSNGAICPAPYAAIPVAVLDSAAYVSLSPTAKAMLLEAVRRHDGFNNGRISLSGAWLRKRGWISRDVLTRAKRGLLDAGFLIETRKGGIAKKAFSSWYAIAWLPVESDRDDLDVVLPVNHAAEFIMRMALTQYRETVLQDRETDRNSTGRRTRQYRETVLKDRETVLQQDRETDNSSNTVRTRGNGSGGTVQ